MKTLFDSLVKYTLDTSSLNEFFDDKRKYTKKHFSGLWNNILVLVENGEIISHREVYEEIMMGHYVELKKWARSNRYIFQNYDLPAEGDFIRRIDQKFPLFVHQGKTRQFYADPWLIAQAKINSLTVITEEKKNNSPRQIPTVCTEFNIKCLDLLGLIKERNWVFR